MGGIRGLSYGPDPKDRERYRDLAHFVNAAKERVIELKEETGALSKITREAAREEQTLLDKLFPMKALAKQYTNDMQAIRNMRAAGILDARCEGEAIDALSAKHAREIRGMHDKTEAAKAQTAVMKESRRAYEARLKSGEGLMDRLFPEEANARAYQEELALLERRRAAGRISAEKAREAEFKLTLAYVQQQEEARKSAQASIEGLNDLERAADRTFRNIDMAVSGAMYSAEDAFVRFVKTGKLEFTDLINVMVEEMLRLQFRETMAPALMGGLNSLVGGLFAPTAPNALATATTPYLPGDMWADGGVGWFEANAFHRGGTGENEASFKRVVSPRVFRDAPRFHAGIGPDETPAIIRKDESVLTPGQMRALAPASEAARGDTITYAPVFQIDARGANDPGLEKRVYAIAKRVTADGFKDFSRRIGRGGATAKMVGRRS